MSDIFMSYSKADHALALKLSAFLEAEGWTVWWDKSLGAADLYRDEIMKQLAAARAVITIWTENSVKSDWVRAEAGTAKREGKLIPVKTPDVAYADIPLPFGEMHTENVGSTELIRAAIVAQLAKPEVPQSPFWQITGLFKYQVLTLVGIVGTAITVFGGLSTALDLADWARALVDHWHEWTAMFWEGIFGWIGVKVPRDLWPIFSFTAFAAILVTGINSSLSIRAKSGNWSNVTFTPRKVLIFIVGVSLYLVTQAILVTPLLFWVLGWWDSVWVGLVAAIVIVVWSVIFPLAYSRHIEEERSWVMITSLLFLFMGACLLIVPLEFSFLMLYYHFNLSYIMSNLHSLKASARNLWDIFVVVLAVAGLFPVCWMAVISFSPLQPLARRLGFVVLGVLTLIVLSEISKLNFHEYLKPTRVSEKSDWQISVPCSADVTSRVVGTSVSPLC
jgi:hypothetical protein